MALITITNLGVELSKLCTRKDLEAMEREFAKPPTEPDLIVITGPITSKHRAEAERQNLRVTHSLPCPE